jgi:TolB-like protein
MENMKFKFLFVIIVIFITISCATSEPAVTDGESTETVQEKRQDNPFLTSSNNLTSSGGTNQTERSGENRTSPRSFTLFNGEGGKGIVIAVPTPGIRGGGTQDAWMPQLFQDLITGDLARFSAMTVLDRSNETLSRAEQQQSLSGDYSETDYIRIGNITNSKYIVAGSILKVSETYTVSFRINNVETNEIQATFSKQYTYQDIEKGLAAKEAARELLFGMGVELTADGEATLLAITETQVRSTAQLARGMTAEKNGNIVEALAFLSDALDTNTTRTEANRHIQTFFVNISTSNIRDRINYASTQKEKWEKIFADLKIYIRENLPIFIYDFSKVEDTINTTIKNVRFKVSPGIKVVPNRAVLMVYKTILDNWFRIKQMEENREWAGGFGISLPKGGLSDAGGYYNLLFEYAADIGLYDDYGDRVANFRLADRPRLEIYYFDSNGRPVPNFSVVAQRKYYDNAKFVPISCDVPFDNITDNLKPRIDRVYFLPRSSRAGIPFKKQVSVMTIPEWEQWLQLQAAEVR